MISALEHYRETAEVLEGWWKIKCEYRKCMRNLKYHKLAFEENLEELLLPLVADEDKLQLLLKEPGGPAWKDQELEDTLRERMPKTYSSYSDTIEMMLETVRELDDALGMSKAHFQARVTGEYTVEKTPSGTRAVMAHVTSIGMQNMEFQAQRIKLAFNKTGRQQLFEDFGSHNQRLRDILGSSDRLASLRQARVPKSSVNAGLWKFWNHGNTLFNLLTEAWSCKCQPFHQANLLLQHRASPTVNFRVVFWFKKHLMVGQPWTWQDTSIKLLEELSTPAVIKLHVPPPTNGASKDIAPPTTLPEAPTEALVLNPAISPLKSSQNVNGKDANKSYRKSFMDKFKPHKTQKSLIAPPEMQTPSSPAKQTSTSTKPKRPALTEPETKPKLKPKVKVAFVDNITLESVEDPTNPKIADLCTKIVSCSADLPKYGCLKGETLRYTVQPLCKAAKEPQQHITLETLLGSSSPVNFTRRQRLQIALILASSHVQLHPTPWLKSKWSKKDIFFLYDPVEPNKICIDQPYISRSLSKSPAQHNSLTPNISATNTYMFQDSIRNLGIMLLELCFGSVIEEHKGRRNISTNDEQSLQLINYAVAIQWSRDVVEEAGPEYSDAVTWCLHNVPDSGDVEGKEERWREDMYVKVVEPLRYCHDQLLAVQKGIV
ncbi:hypothetical protein LHYA1_G003227 [Lachnellula hyalina]|uniref:DUF7580 domain-containing protein n=1 Tax=Lachnellula hyalina TaxID=1316788 RepID=A0A8H8U0M7_9HELO|nr:uncharacterized protein LHYA1_G003227 [Lachnellula hyalina]TVY27490.1 hypothetical protein LHYA1_G003227 [Lachnellula hyalina]